MTFANPVALWWLLAVPAVVALHLFRRRLVEKRVAALFLFAGDRLVASAGRQRTRLLNTPSLWLECLAAAALALWLAGPSFGARSGRHLVVVLDDSASMGVHDAKAGKAAVALRLDRLPTGSRVTFVRTGPRPAVLGEMSRSRNADDVLERWQPAQPRHDPLPAIDLARELAGASGEVLFVTDAAPPPGCNDIDVVAVGDALANAALLTVRRVPRADGEDLFVRVGVFGSMASTTLTIDDGGREIAREVVVFRDGLADLTFALPKDLGALHLRLAPDALAIDDEVLVAPEPERIVAVCDLLPAETQQRLQLPRVFDALRGERLVTDPRDAQIVIAREPGLVLPGQTELVIAAPADGAERDGWRGPFVIDRSEPLLAGVQLQGVTWVAPRRVLPGRVLVAAGATALVTEEPLDVGRRLWCAIDPAAGNLARSPDWPVLWTNLLDAASRDVPGLVDANVVVGGEVRWRKSLVAGRGDATITFVAPDGTRTVGKGQRTVSVIAERPGAYRVLGDGDRELGVVAARFLDPAESDLRGGVAGSWPRSVVPADGGDGAGCDLHVERLVLALLVLVVALVDWWWLSRGGR